MSLTNATPLDIAQSAREGSRTLAVLQTEQRNAALTAIHKALADGKEEVLAANAKDLEAANKAAAGGTLSASLVKRLDLGKPGKYKDMLQGILDVVELEDPSMCNYSSPDSFNWVGLPYTNNWQSTRPLQRPCSMTISHCHA
jgi:glutamate-5-semialdehyde dehydrogenase